MSEELGSETWRQSTSPDNRRQHIEGIPYILDNTHGTLLNFMTWSVVLCPRQDSGLEF